MVVGFIDLETRKVPVEPPYINPDRPARPITKRWQPFLIGVSTDAPGVEVTIFQEKTGIHFGLREWWLYTQLSNFLLEHQVDTLVYTATRLFDEMICKGRFINARRELLNSPGPWPRLLLECDWVCLPAQSNPDGMSKDVPWLWDRGNHSDKMAVMRHLTEDVTNVKSRWLAGERP